MKNSYPCPIRSIGLSFFLIILPIASNVIVGQNRNGTLPYRFLIPEGYVGWVRVDFDVASAPALPIEEGYYVFKFPTSGRLQTSSSDIVDSRRNQFFYYSEKGNYQLRTGGPLSTRMVQEEFSGPGPGHVPPVPNRYRYIFIGPREVFETNRALDTQRRPKESDGYPKVGAQTWLTQEDLEKIIPSDLEERRALVRAAASRAAMRNCIDSQLERA